mmetsp:Transcript_39186/g.98060  ORF Transcript_39186/g.98060 Transcript_39186/m.98060 type:complete len:89 (+) Transcript_39186:275-541(+)
MKGWMDGPMARKAVHPGDACLRVCTCSRRKSLADTKILTRPTQTDKTKNASLAPTMSSPAFEGPTETALALLSLPPSLAPLHLIRCTV